jgi:hypothetical protein
MKALSEAFACLRKPALRELYDRCLREKLDFSLEVTAFQTPKAGKQAAEVIDLSADTADLKRRVSALVQGSFACDESDDYFDFVMQGRLGPSQCWLYGKALDYVCSDDLEGIIAYADQLEVPSGSALARDHLNFVLQGRRLQEPKTVKGMVERFNARMRSVPRGKPLKAIVVVPGPGKAPYVPFEDLVKPSFSKMPS